MKKLSTLVAVALFALAASAQWLTQPQSSGDASDVPAYNRQAPSRPLPPVLAGGQLTGPYFRQPYKVVVYQMAARITAVLHQQPCYCRCDREMGHNSLHSCFEGLHGAACSTCMKEAVYAYQQTKLHRSPAQIRTGIERGEWMNVDLEKAKL